MPDTLPTWVSWVHLVLSFNQLQERTRTRTRTHTHTQLHGSKVVTTPYLHIQVVPFPRRHLSIYIYTHMCTQISWIIHYISYTHVHSYSQILTYYVNTHIYIYICVCVLLKTPAHEVHFAFFRVLRTVVKCFPFFVPARSLEPMLPRIWGLCARLLHAIYLFML